MIHVTVNGQLREVEGELDIASFLRRHGRDPRLIVVELNGEIVRPSDFEQAILRDGDKLEVVHMVAGG